MSDKLKGTTFPPDGKNFHQNDWKNEQESKSEEIINRQKDIAGSGVVSGGLITPGTNSGTIRIFATIAYNKSGQRISIPETNNIPCPEGASKVVIRHKFVETPNNNSQGYPVQHRDNSFEILFQASLINDDVGLFDISNTSGTVIVGSDIRQNWKMKTIEASIANSVTLNDNQTILGTKTFTPEQVFNGGLKLGIGVSINKFSSDKTLSGNSDSAVSTEKAIKAYFDLRKRNSFKNKVINGNFDKWDYNITQTSSGYGSDNRWANWHTGGTKTHTKETFTIGQTVLPDNPDNYSKTVRVHSVGAANCCMKQQRIENVKESNKLKYTKSFWFKSDAVRNIAVDFTQNFGSGGSADVHRNGNVTKIAVTTTWTKYTVRVEFPSITGKTIGDDNYYSVNFWYDAGSDFDSRTTNLGHQSGDFELAHVQFEKGEIATNFEVLPKQIIDMLCKYFYRTYQVSHSMPTSRFFSHKFENIRNAPNIIRLGDWYTTSESGTSWNTYQTGTNIYILLANQSNSYVGGDFTIDSEL